MTAHEIPSRNYLEKITEVYVFVSMDKDGEGIISRSFGDLMLPFVCADKERMEQLKPIAKNMARQTGKKIKLIKLTHREEIEEYA